jgi:hypothetical protein
MIADLKGKLKLAPNLEKKKKKKKDNKAKDKDDKGSTGGRDNKKKKIKKATSNKKNQKKEEAWKRVPPKEGKAKEKIVKEKTYHWCEHHMAWGIHPPKDCCLGLSRPLLPLQPLQAPPLLPSSPSCPKTNVGSEQHVCWACLQRIWLCHSTTTLDKQSSPTFYS